MDYDPFEIEKFAVGGALKNFARGAKEASGYAKPRVRRMTQQAGQQWRGLGRKKQAGVAAGGVAGVSGVGYMAGKSKGD